MPSYTSATGWNFDLNVMTRHAESYVARNRRPDAIGRNKLSEKGMATIPAKDYFMG